jgi:hypothetical protein
VRIDCSPVVRIRVVLHDGQPGPDLSVTRWERDLVLRATVGTGEGPRHDLERVDLERHARVLFLRGFREGKLTGELWLGHRYFLPDRWLHASLDGELVRGRTIDVGLTLSDLGGAIELTDPTGRAVLARLRDVDGKETSTEIHDHHADFANLPAGNYRVELCADAECAAVLAAWSEVEVRRLATVNLNGAAAGLQEKATGNRDRSILRAPER